MLELNGVHKAFGAKQVLNGLDLAVAAGELFVLLGPNGAGKSTTFSIICGLLLADAGSVAVEGAPLTRMRRDLVGVVPQRTALYHDLSPEENLRFFGSLYGVPRALLPLRVGECLDAVGLRDRASTPVRELSGGTQRRVHIAAALVHRPKLLLLDEPSVGLDIESREAVAALIRRMRGSGTAILLCTHIFEEAQALCTRVGILRGGRITVQGSLEAVCAGVPAQQIAMVRTAEPSAASARCAANGAMSEQIEGGLKVFLPRRVDFTELAGWFDGSVVSSLTLRDVSLEDVYLCATRASP